MLDANVKKDTCGTPHAISVWLLKHAHVTTEDEATATVIQCSKTVTLGNLIFSFSFEPIKFLNCVFYSITLSLFTADVFKESGVAKPTNVLDFAALTVIHTTERLTARNTSFTELTFLLLLVLAKTVNINSK